MIGLHKYFDMQKRLRAGVIGYLEIRTNSDSGIINGNLTFLSLVYLIYKLFINKISIDLSAVTT